MYTIPIAYAMHIDRTDFATTTKKKNRQKMRQKKCRKIELAGNHRKEKPCTYKLNR